MAHLPNVELSNETWNETKASVVAVGVFQDTSLTPMASHINEAADGLFSKAIEMGDVKGKEGESKLFYVDGKRVQLLGLGKKEEFDHENYNSKFQLRIKKDIKLLHIAPEQCLINVFSKSKNIEYVSGDLFSPLAKIKMDIHNMPFQNNSFDIILCNHVLEHVEDDKKAIKDAILFHYALDYGLAKKKGWWKNHTAEGKTYGKVTRIIQQSDFAAVSYTHLTLPTKA